MESIETIRQLAQRMNASEEVAWEWLEALQELQSGNIRTRRGSSAVEGALAAILRPVTPESRQALQGEELEMRRFPFRIGREGRSEAMKRAAGFRNRRLTASAPNNDRYLHDRGTPLNISREHFQIERAENGSFTLVDRGSTCGTIVSGYTVGGEHTKGICSLVEGDIIVLGTPQSPYQFEFFTMPQH